MRAKWRKYTLVLDTRHTHTLALQVEDPVKLEQVQAQPLAHFVPALRVEAAACRRRRPEKFAITMRAASPGAEAGRLFEPQDCRGRRFEAHVEQLRRKTCKKVLDIVVDTARSTQRSSRQLQTTSRSESLAKH